MPRIKVIHLVDDLRSGGLERIVMTLARHLDSSQFETEVWCLSQGGELADELTAEGRTVKVLNIRSYYNPIQIIKLAVLFKRYQPDILHTHIYFASTIGRIAAKLAGVSRVVTHMHNVYFHYRRRNLRMDHLLSHVSDRIICCSKAVERFVVRTEKINPEKVTTIHNGIDMKRFETPLDQRALRRSFDMEEGELLLINVAALMEKKGHQYLFESLARLVKDQVRFKCLIVGYGSKEEERIIKSHVKRLSLENQVMFLGLRDDVPDLLRIADIFVLSSLMEGLPLSVMEAMAAGLPIVATDAGGVNEILENSISGIVVPPGDSEALYKGIRTLVDQPFLAKELGANAFRISRERFHSRDLVRKVEQVYLDLLARKPS